MSDTFINEKNNNVTEEYISYLSPLIGTLPNYEQLSAPEVKID
jgi:hypothetical protein